MGERGLTRAHHTCVLRLEWLSSVNVIISWRDGAMPVYRIFWFDQDDHITKADYLLADADDQVR